MSSYYKRINISGGSGGGGTAADTTYDPTASGISAVNVQQAIDLLAAGSYKPRPLITLDADDITAKSIDIVVTPASPTLTRLSVGGVEQTYGIDFSVSGTTLSWSGLGLDGVLEVNDILIITLK